MIETLLEQQEPLVEIRDLHVQFGSQKVLRGINLTIPAGQTLALLGESGCGKTVLMKSIIGLVKPTKGKVIFDHEDLAQLTDREINYLRLRYGFVFQNAALFDSMTVGQNVAFPLRQQGRLLTIRSSKWCYRDSRKSACLIQSFTRSQPNFLVGCENESDWLGH